jgi:alpha-tubulin suppressor-like RCC1 family protein
VDLAAGRNHTLALLQDGTVVAWGTNDFGQLNVPAGLTNVTAVAAGGYHNLALQADGTLVGWGRNTYGEASIPAAATNVTAIAAGDFHSVVLRADGTVLAWGYNNYQQTNLTGLGTNQVIAVAAGGNQTIALLANGTCKGWGNNGYGTPFPPQSLSNVRAIAVGANVCASLKTDGTVVVWGNSFDSSYKIPAAATNGVVRVAIGAQHGLVLRTNGVITAWGANTYSQTNVPPGATNAFLVAAGGTHSVAVVNDGSPQFVVEPQSTWGYVGTTVSFSAVAVGAPPLSYQWRSATTPNDPVAIANATNRVLSLSNLQLNSAGTYDLVVSNAFGTNVSRGATLTVVDAAPSITQPPVDTAVTRGLSASLSVGVQGSQPLSYQWLENGTNLPGAVNSMLYYFPSQPANSSIYQVIVANHLGSVTSAPVVLEVDSVGGWNGGYGGLPLGLTNTVAVDCGRAHFLALTADGRAISWGSYIMGGNSPRSNDLTNIVAIAAGYDHNLALRSDGTVAGWGSDYDYNSILVGQATPPAGLTNVVSIAAGAWHSLALTRDGTVVGWGDAAGYLVGGLTNVIGMSGGEFHSLFLKADGTVVAAGDNTYGQTSVPPGLSNVVAVKAEYTFSIALQADGQVVCWGSQPSPSWLTNAIAIAGGPSALTADGMVVAWGSGATPNPPPSGVVALAASVYQSIYLLGDEWNVTPFSLSAPRMANGAFNICVPTSPNRRYFLQARDVLTGTSWMNVTGVAGDGTLQTLADPLPPAAGRFYRVARY